MVVVLLLGFVLAWPGVFATPGYIGGTAQVAKKSCCRTDCDTTHCSTPACCIQRGTPSVPFAPACLPSASQNQFQALAASVVSPLAPPSLTTHAATAHALGSVSVTAIPLFQRHCSYRL